MVGAKPRTITRKTASQITLRKCSGKIWLFSAVLCLVRAPLTAQLVKNPSAMQETPVRFLGWEDPLEKG